jgi:hypothetical protein
MGLDVAHGAEHMIARRQQHFTVFDVLLLRRAA